MRCEYDVLVAGRGPAAFAAGFFLLRRGWRVAICGRVDSEAPHGGETLPGSVRALLARLGLGDTFDRSAQQCCHSHYSYWGQDSARERSAMFNPFGGGCVLRRAALLACMEQEFLQGGGVIHDGTVRTLHMASAGGQRYELELQLECGASRVSASALVDATGRTARLARQLGAMRQTWASQVASGLLYAGRAGRQLDASSMLEALPQGWAYAAPLGPSEAAVWCVHDREGKPTAKFAQQMESSRHIRGWLASMELVPMGKVMVRDAAVSALNRTVGDGWVAVGDAALSLDPLSSSGIAAALISGSQGGESVDAWLRGNAAQLAEYDATLKQVLASHLTLRRLIYGLERRWTQQRFWHERTTAMSASV